MALLKRGQTLQSGTDLEKQFDRVIQPMLDAINGKQFRFYCDATIIKDGESYKEQYGTPGNFTRNAPNLYGSEGVDQATGTAGGTRSFEVTARYVYGFEVLGAYDRKGLKTITENDWFIQNLINALEVGEDLVIIESLEEVDAILPEDNKIGDPKLPLYHPLNLEKFKATLIYANARYNNKRTKASFGAFCIIHALDWAKVALRNTNAAIFANSDYSQVTGINGLSYNTVCGVAFEQVDKLDREYGDEDNKRDYIVQPGTIRICVMDNIKFVAFEDDTLREVNDSLMNSHTFSMEVAKSMGAKVKDPKGVWKFSCLPEAKLNDIKPVALGEKDNPIHQVTESGAGA